MTGTAVDESKSGCHGDRRVHHIMQFMGLPREGSEHSDRTCIGDWLLSAGCYADYETISHIVIGPNIDIVSAAELIVFCNVSVWSSYSPIKADGSTK